jgi:hypothetical protein
LLAELGEAPRFELTDDESLPALAPAGWHGGQAREPGLFPAVAWADPDTATVFAE